MISMNLLSGLLLALNAEGGQLNIKGGLPPVLPSSEIKMFAVNYTSRFLMSDVFIHQIEYGFWADRNEKRRSSHYGSYSLGIGVDNNVAYASAVSGVGFITSPDSLLGGPFQFFHDADVGFIGLNNIRLGLGFKHISSADLYQPNFGRDFITFKIGIPF